MAVWRSGNIFRCIGEVILYRAQLVLGCVTIFGWGYHRGM